MSKLIRLTDYVHIDPNTVVDVKVVSGSHTDRLFVSLSNGASHEVGCDYGKSIWDTQTRIIALINGARDQE